MDEVEINGNMRSFVKLSKEEIEVLLGFVDATDELDDDEVNVINGIVRGLPAESVYDIRWFENKLERQRRLPRQK